MHRSQTLSTASTIRRARAAAARNGAVSERRNAGELIFAGCDSARGGAPGPRGQLLLGARTGLSRARYGVVPRTDDQPLSDHSGPAGRVLTTEHAAGEPILPDDSPRRHKRAVRAEALADRARHENIGALPSRGKSWDRTTRVGRTATRRRRTDRSSSTRLLDSRRELACHAWPVGDVQQ